MAASLQAWQRAVGNSASGGSAFEVGGLVASVVPSARSRSLVNAAAASHPVAIDAEALDALATGYLDAGCEVWGDWVGQAISSAPLRASSLQP